MARLKLGVLISGRGTNLQALIDACGSADFPAAIALVVSNEPAAAGLARAAAVNIETAVVDHRDHADRTAFEAALDAALRGAGVDLICLAGFMRLLGPGFVEAWRDRIINIHPSLLPAFKGLHAHEQAIEAGVRVSGCTVHFVRAAMDAGPIIAQAAVAVGPGDDADRLAARVLEAEHRCYPMAVRLIAEGRVRVLNERVEITGAEAADDWFLNPSARAP